MLKLVQLRGYSDCGPIFDSIFEDGGCRHWPVLTCRPFRAPMAPDMNRVQCQPGARDCGPSVLQALLPGHLLQVAHYVAHDLRQFIFLKLCEPPRRHPKFHF